LLKTIQSLQLKVKTILNFVNLLDREENIL